MKKALSSKHALLLAAALMLSAGGASAVSLQIDDYRAGKRLACIPLTDNRFALSFIHSVSLTPVTDFYQIHDDGKNGSRMVQTAEHFIAHGQGLPSLQDEPDALAFEHRDGKFILHLQRPIHDLIVRTDQRFQNRLHLQHQTINLNQWPDTGLRIAPVDHCK
ncbi:DUF1850 domain-containing protein [Endozoicomonadaceae bacterium StTr2]